jgi:phosphohistidine phosphatase
MKKLYVIRHAKANDAAAGVRDFDRRLTSKGKGQAEKMGKYFAEHAISADLVISSPAPRALETAGIFCGETGFRKKDIVAEPDVYDASLSGLLGVIRAYGGDSGSLFLFGHNPSVTELVHYLTGNGPGNMKKGSAVFVQLNIGDWTETGADTGTFVWYLIPGEIAK